MTLLKYFKILEKEGISLYDLRTFKKKNWLNLLLIKKSNPDN